MLSEGSRTRVVAVGRAVKRSTRKLPEGWFLRSQRVARQSLDRAMWRLADTLVVTSLNISLACQCQVKGGSFLLVQIKNSFPHHGGFENAVYKIPRVFGSLVMTDILPVKLQRNTRRHDSPLSPTGIPAASDRVIMPRRVTVQEIQSGDLTHSRATKTLAH